MEKVQAGQFVPIPVAPLVIVGTNVCGKANYMAVGFVSGINVSPPIICISINKNHYSIKGILENKTFSINIPTAKYVNETDYCGLVSGKTFDKSGIFTAFYGNLRTAPMIMEFPITCECEWVKDKIDFDMDTAFFGEVKQVYMNKDLIRGEKEIDISKEEIFYYSGLENEYRLQGKCIGEGWTIGKEIMEKAVCGG